MTETTATDRLKAVLQEIHRESGLMVQSVNVRWEYIQTMGQPSRGLIHRIDLETSKGY